MKDVVESASQEEKLTDRGKSKVMDPTTEIHLAGLRTRRPVLLDHREQNRETKTRETWSREACGPIKGLEFSFCKWWASPWRSESGKWKDLLYSFQEASLRAGSTGIHTAASEKCSAGRMCEPRMALAQFAVAATARTVDPEQWTL